MIGNPYLPSPPAAAAWAEGFTKGYLSIAAPEPSPTISEADYEAFNRGVEEGARCATQGLPPDQACFDAADEPSEEVERFHRVVNIFDLLHIGKALWKLKHVSHAVCGTAVLLIELAVTLPKHVRPLEDVLGEAAQAMADLLASYGFDSIEFFCGVGIEQEVRGCEVQITPLFRTQEQAREAAIAMNRYEWAVVSWRTDQSNSFHVVEGGYRG